MKTGVNQNSNESGYRHWLASIITLVSILGVIVLAIVLIVNSSDKSGSAHEVMGTVLPLLGTWVGTVLAYYFSKENFEAATKSVSNMAKAITPQEKLQSIAVTAKMIRQDKMFYKRLPEDKIILVDALDEMGKQNKGSRLPILTDKNYPAYVIHRSLIDKYLVDKARSGKIDLIKLTMADLLKDDTSLKHILEKSFAVVKESDTLADAKNAMERIDDCQDVFVTKGGNKDEEVRGWITNVIIAENSRV